MEISTIEHASITPENRAAFSTHMEKFDSFEAAAVDGMGLKKMTGAPFKMPESMDKLPDDASRADFTAQARRALGINIPKDVEALKDVNFKSGLADGAPYNEEFVGLVKAWAVENGIDTATLEKFAPFYNGPLTEYATKAHKELGEKTFNDNAKATHEGLVTHFNGSEAKVTEESELLKRAVLNHPGMTSEKAEKVADIFVDVMQKGGSDAAIVLLEMIAPMAREGGSHAGKGGNPLPIEKTPKEQLPKTAEALNW